MHNGQEEGQGREPGRIEWRKEAELGTALGLLAPYGADGRLEAADARELAAESYRARVTLQALESHLARLHSLARLGYVTSAVELEAVRRLAGSELLAACLNVCAIGERATRGDDAGAVGRSAGVREAPRHDAEARQADR